MNSFCLHISNEDKHKRSKEFFRFHGKINTWVFEITYCGKYLHFSSPGTRFGEHWNDFAFVLKLLSLTSWTGPRHPIFKQHEIKFKHVLRQKLRIPTDRSTITSSFHIQFCYLMTCCHCVLSCNPINTVKVQCF